MSHTPNARTDFLAPEYIATQSDYGWSGTEDAALKLLKGPIWGNGNGAPLTLNYNMFEALPAYYESTDQEASNFQAFNAQMQSATLRVLDEIETFTNLTFNETGVSAAHLGFGQTQLPSNAGAWAYFPHPHPKGGDVWTNNLHANTQNPVEGNYGYFVLSHEIGHALGLRHSFDVLSGAEATSRYSVMAYDWPFFPQSYMLYDIYALQSIYGENLNHATGDDIYTLSNTLTSTIWDAGGTDTFDASYMSSNVVLNLNDGAFSTVGINNGIGIAFNTVIENAWGGGGNDKISGNVANNILKGFSGNDTLIGSSGNDTIDGGADIDTVIYAFNLADAFIELIDTITVKITDLLGIFGEDTIKNVENFAFADDTYSFSQLENSVDQSDINPISFDQNDFSSYSNQDNAKTAVSVTEDGEAVTITNNSWKKLSFDYAVTDNTMLEFDFKSTNTGEIQGLMFETDNSLNYRIEKMFQVAGSQDQNYVGLDLSYSGNGDWESFNVNAGDYYSGDINYLVFANDDDASNSANASFRNIKIYEGDGTPSSDDPSDENSLSFYQNDFSGYSNQDNASLQVEITDNGAGVTINKNSWKKLSFDYDVTENTVLEFDFKSTLIGEVQGIMFETDTFFNYRTEKMFQVAGSQDQNYEGLDLSYSGDGDWQSFSVNAGDYYSGDINYLVFANDDDASNSANASFRNIKIYESDPSASNAAIELSDILFDEQADILIPPSSVTPHEEKVETAHHDHHDDFLLQPDHYLPAYTDITPDSI